jgi:hypothetical protein
MKLDRLLSAKDIAERYGKSEKTAMRYMRQMEHMEKPLRVTEQALEAWEIGRTYEPQRETREKPARVRRVRPDPGERYIIPRKRPVATQKAR